MYFTLTRFGESVKQILCNISLLCPTRLGGMFDFMEASVVSEYLAKIGRKGGKARLKTMTAEERTEIATRASRAAAAARTKKAKAKEKSPAGH